MILDPSNQVNGCDHGIALIYPSIKKIRKLSYPKTKRNCRQWRGTSHCLTLVLVPSLNILLCILDSWDWTGCSGSLHHWGSSGCQCLTTGLGTARLYQSLWWRRATAAAGHAGRRHRDCRVPVTSRSSHVSVPLLWHTACDISSSSWHRRLLPSQPWALATAGPPTLPASGSEAAAGPRTLAARHSSHCCCNCYSGSYHLSLSSGIWSHCYIALWGAI